MANAAMLGKAFIQVAMDASKVPAELNKTQTAVKSGMGKIKKDAEGGMASLTGYLGDLKNAMAGLAAGGAAGAAVKGFADYADKIYKTATRLQVNPQFVAEWKYIAGSLGISAESLDQLATKLNGLARNAMNGNADAVKTLEKMGIKAEEFVDMPLEDKLDSLRKSIRGASSEAEAQAIAIGALGESAGQFMGVLNLDDEAFNKLREDARKFGIEFSELDFAKGEDAAQAFFNLQTTSKMLWYQMGAALAGPATKLLNFLAELIGSTSRMVHGINAATKGWAGWIAACSIAAGVGFKLLPIIIRITGALLGLGKGVAALKMLSSAALLLTNPWIALGAAIVGVSVYLGTLSGGFQDTMGAIKDHIAAGDVQGAWEDLWDGMKAYFSGWGEWLEAAYKGYIFSVIKATSAALNYLGIHELDNAAKEAQRSFEDAAADYENKREAQLKKLHENREKAADDRKRAEEELAKKEEERAKAWQNNFRKQMQGLEEIVEDTKNELGDASEKSKEDTKDRYNYAAKSTGSFSAAEATSMAGNNVTKIAKDVETMVQLQQQTNQHIARLGVAK